MAARGERAVRAVAAALCALALLAALTGRAGATPGQATAEPPVAAVDPAVAEQVAEAGTASVLVVTEPGEGGAGADRVRQQLDAGDEGPAGGDGARVLRSPAPVVAATVDGGDLAALAASPDVAEVLPNRFHRLDLASSTAAIGAPAAWASGATGAGTSVAIIDTGVDGLHPALLGKLAAEACFSGGGPSYLRPQGLCPGPDRTTAQGVGAAEPCTVSDLCGHGTHVAGTAAGRAVPAVSTSGVAPDATILAAQVMTLVRDRSACGGQDTCMGAFEADILEAMGWVIDQAGRRDVAAVNLSLGGDAGPTCRHAVAGAVTTLAGLGVATVASSGNGGRTTAISAPACLPGVVSVGAWDDGTGQVAPFSNSSRQLDLLAPGVGVRGPAPVGTTVDGYVSASGTSMAAPHVTGSLALLRQAKGPLTVDQALSLLRRSGLPVLDGRNGVTTPLVQVGAVVAAQAPLGALDAITQEGGDLVVAGWALDLDDAAPVAVTVTVGGEAAWSGWATGSRSDVAAQFPAWGAGRGYTSPRLTGLAGTAAEVCVVAHDQGRWPAADARWCGHAPGPFLDVHAGNPFVASVSWAVATGIVEGYPDGTYRPAQPVTRGAAAALLHRYAGSPPPPPGAPTFSDVPPDHPFHQATAWLAATGIAEGHPDGTYRPGQPVTRQVAAALLHRYDQG